MQGPTPAPTAVCAFCGKQLAMGEINYTPDARAACNQCNAKVDLVVTEMRGGHGPRNAAITSICLAAGGFLCNPFALMTLSSMICAIYSLAAAKNAPNDKGVIYSCAIIALVLDALVVVILIMALMALSAAKSHGYGDY